MLEHRNYLKVAQGNLELIRGDIWDIEFVKWPDALYNPGIDLLKARLKDIETPSLSEPVLLEKDVLGHKIYSPGGRNGSPGDVTLNFIDREDQAITYMIQNYVDAHGDPDNGFSRHKAELFFHVNIIFYNTLLKPFRKLECTTGLYGGHTIPDNPGDHGTDLSEVSLTLKFQQVKRVPL